MSAHKRRQGLPPIQRPSCEGKNFDSPSFSGRGDSVLTSLLMGEEGEEACQAVRSLKNSGWKHNRRLARSWRADLRVRRLGLAPIAQAFGRTR